MSYQIAVSTTAARNFALQVNGIAVPGGHAQTGPAGRNVSAQAILNLVAGDVVRVVNISTAAVGLLVQGTATQQTNASMLVVRIQ